MDCRLKINDQRPIAKDCFLVFSLWSVVVCLFLSGCASARGSYPMLEKDLPGKQYRPEIVDKAVRTADYTIVNSYIIGAVTRPFSYIQRVVSLSRNTAYDVAVNSAFVFHPENSVIPPLSKGPGMNLDEFEKRLDVLTRRKGSDGTMRFLIGGEEFFSRLEEEIKGAKESIDVRIFIFDGDDYGVKIADLLKKKSLEGIKVRVLLDSTGQVLGEGKTADDQPKDFVAPYSMVTYLRRDSKIQVRLRPDALFRADHTKTITIDHRIGFTGGMNIGREYRYDWHDMMIELEGPVLRAVRYEFDLAWAHAGFWGDFGYAMARFWKKHPKAEGEGRPMRMLYTRADNSEIFRAQLEAIERAKKYIWISNAYFSDNDVLYGLIRARRRGVDVRIIFPKKGNHEIMNKSNVVTANILFRNGIQVYFYPGMSHIKAAIYDGWLCTGSANFDTLSFRDNLEMDVATSDPSVVEGLKKRLFEKDFSRSQLMTEPLKSNLMDVIAETFAEQL